MEPRTELAPRATPALTVRRQGRVLTISDPLGGEATIDLQREVPQVVDWHSVPRPERYGPNEASLKQRGFARAVVAALAQMGVTQFGISLQSMDTQKAMARMIATGAVTAVPGYTAGPSDAPHPTRFAIGPAPQPVVQLLGEEGNDRDLLSGRLRIDQPATRMVSAPVCPAPGGLE